jgi:aspartyl protease family protein
MKLWLIAVCVFLGFDSAAAALTTCIIGEQVADPRGKNGLIVWSGGDFCRVRYEDGQSYGWMSRDLKAAEAAKTSDLALSPEAGPSTTNRPVERASSPTVLKPPASALVYRADPQGHFRLTATVNGAALRFLLDTGASLVFLSPEDARAAGINRGDLVFDKVVQTGNGRARAASVLLPEVRIERLAIEKVPAAVMENLHQSVLGMSFLSRLKGFEIHEGFLTLSR